LATIIPKTGIFRQTKKISVIMNEENWTNGKEKEVESKETESKERVSKG